MEPFPTSVLQVLIEVFATTTKICTRSCFIQAYAKDFVTTSTPSYTLLHCICNNGWVSVTRLSAIHFRG